MPEIVQSDHECRLGVIQAIQTVREVAICPKHDLELSYYCETCDTPVCSDCAVVDQEVGRGLCRGCTATILSGRYHSW